MIKPRSLRAALAAASRYLADNPEALHVRIERGEIHSTAAGGLSFEYAYDLVVLVTDYAGHPDTLFLPIVAWLHDAQPDLLENPARRTDFSFETDVLDGEKYDVEIRLAKMTERVTVSLALADIADDDPSSTPIRIPVPKGLVGPGVVATVAHEPEPAIDPLRYVERWRYYAGHPDSPDSDLLREYDVPPFDGPVTSTP